MIFQNCLKLRISISKYHSWYLCQISLHYYLYKYQRLLVNFIFHEEHEVADVCSVVAISRLIDSNSLTQVFWFWLFSLKTNFLPFGPVQFDFLQARPSVLLPSHSLPPFCGKGLLHARERSWKPDPQETLHGLHSDQSEKPPSTVEKNKNISRNTRTLLACSRAWCLK